MVDAKVRNGKGRGTKSPDIDHADVDVDDHNVADDGGDGDGCGHEKMMWEREGLGCKFIPKSLAIVHNL